VNGSIVRGSHNLKFLIEAQIYPKLNSWAQAQEAVEDSFFGFSEFLGEIFNFLSVVTDVPSRVTRVTSHFLKLQEVTLPEGSVPAQRSEFLGFMV
jgi:hypothetical protein